MNNDPDGVMLDFYETQVGSSIDLFLQMEEHLYQGNSSAAADIIVGMDASGFNTVETNYKTFYTLYLAYLALDVDEKYSEENRSALEALAQLCPGTNGNCIYQAIALYNTLYGEILIPDCSESGAKMANNLSEEKKATGTLELEIFPNPAQNQLTIKGKKQNEHLKILIKDLSGRMVLNTEVRSKGFIATLDLELLNGAYIITIIGIDNKNVTKKLLINK